MVPFTLQPTLLSFEQCVSPLRALIYVLRLSQEVLVPSGTPHMSHSGAVVVIWTNFRLRSNCNNQLASPGQSVTRGNFWPNCYPFLVSGSVSCFIYLFLLFFLLSSHSPHLPLSFILISRYPLPSSDFLFFPFPTYPLLLFLLQLHFPAQLSYSLFPIPFIHALSSPYLPSSSKSNLQISPPPHLLSAVLSNLLLFFYYNERTLIRERRSASVDTIARFLPPAHGYCSSSSLSIGTRPAESSLKPSLWCLLGCYMSVLPLANPLESICCLGTCYLESECSSIPKN